MSEEGCADFCRSVRPRLVGALGLYVGDAGLAEELAQEALVRTWERWDRVAAMDRPEAYVYRTAFNLARSSFRRRAAERRANRRVGAAGAYVLPDAADAVAVRAAVAALPERQRAAVVARFYAGLDVAATAAALGCAEGTVKALTHQAVDRLRAAGLGHEDEEQPCPI